MAPDDRSVITDASGFSAASHKLASPLDLFFKRPLLIGVIATLASLIYCGALTQTITTPEAKPRDITAAADPSRHLQPERSENVPLLSLAVIGLASLALSQARPSPEPEHRESILSAGKNVARGQELPRTNTNPEPALALSLASLRTQERHHDIANLEPIR